MKTRAAHSFVGDPFAELGLTPMASLDEVRRAFRRRARETHPDHQPDDPDAHKRFARLRAAYEEAFELAKRRSGTASSSNDHTTAGTGQTPRRRRVLTEHELAAKAEESSDQGILRRMLARYGHRAIIAAALARNPSFPTHALDTLREATENHWTVEAAIADRDDAPHAMLDDIASMARETVIGRNIVRNKRTTRATLDALVDGPIRLDPALERDLAAHGNLSVAAADRLASRYATDPGVVIRLIQRGDLPAETVYRLAGQTTRSHVAEAARYDLVRRDLPVPPSRAPGRPPKTLTGYWR